MEGLGRAVRAIYAINRVVGTAASWLILVSVVVCAFVAIARYAFGFGLIWIQEIYVVAFGLSFMLVAAYAYARDQHVRVDIVQQRWSPKTRAMVEIFCIIVFLLPWTGLVAWAAWPFVKLAWAVREGSSQAGGLQGYYLVKTVILVFAGLMALQGLARIGASLLVINEREDLLPIEAKGVVPRDEVMEG